MRILIAEDERISRRLLENTLQGWGHEVVVTCDGLEAWAALQQADGPQFAILDWMMPGRDGLGVCRKVRETPETKSIYIILLTAKGETNDLIAGLDAGANDYVAKPFNREELRARVQVGVRMVELQQAVAADLKERERAEEALRKSEEQLRQSQKLEAIGQLAGGVAHDFNNLLTAITGYSQLSLRRLSPDDPLRHNLEEILKAGNRAASLTRQLLAFSRKQILQPRVLNLNSLVTNMGQMLDRLLPESIEFVTVLRPVGQINADPGQIEQVLMNLVVNARDAMSHRGKITIETGDLEIDDDYARMHDSIQPGPHVRLTVSDTGRGMDAETQEQFLSPSSPRKRSGKALGWGCPPSTGSLSRAVEVSGFTARSESGRPLRFTCQDTCRRPNRLMPLLNLSCCCLELRQSCWLKMRR